MTNVNYQRLLSQPCLIAHRGFSLTNPENTLLAFEQAYKAGACCIEFDVQLSRDLVPVVIHDDTLNRTSDSEGNVFELTAEELSQRSVGEPLRFEDQYTHVTLPLVSDVVRLMQRWPDRLAMVEIKRASLRKFGLTECLERIVVALQPVMERCVFISFSDEVLAVAKARGLTVGFVFDEWNEPVLLTARQLSPTFVVVDAEVVPAGIDLRSGPWHWMVYAIDDPTTALAWAARGVALVETNDIGGLLKDKRLSRWGCASHAI